MKMACYHSCEYEEALQAQINTKIEREYKRAKREAHALSGLLRDVAAYNFVIKNKIGDWSSHVHLHGARFQTFWRNGHEREIGHFPIYYSGPVADAPKLPAEILLKEVQDAHAELCHWRELRNAATDWAPGGCKYYQMLADPQSGATAYRKMYGEAFGGKVGELSNISVKH